MSLFHGHYQLRLVVSQSVITFTIVAVGLGLVRSVVPTAVFLTWKKNNGEHVDTCFTELREEYSHVYRRKLSLDRSYEFALIDSDLHL